MTRIPEAAIAGRHVLGQASRAEPVLTRTELYVVNAVISLTALYGKLEDTVALSQIAEAANLHPKTAARVLAALSRRHDVGITYTPGRGAGVYSVVSIENGAGPAVARSVSSSTKGSAGTPNRAPLSEAKKGARQAVHGVEKGARSPLAVAPPKRSSEETRAREPHKPNPAVKEAMARVVADLKTPKPAPKENP